MLREKCSVLRIDSISLANSGENDFIDVQLENPVAFGGVDGDVFSDMEVFLMGKHEIILALYFLAISIVLSVDRSSATTISSASWRTDSKHLAKLASSLRVARTTDNLIFFISWILFLNTGWPDGKLMALTMLTPTSGISSGAATMRDRMGIADL